MLLDDVEAVYPAVVNTDGLQQILDIQ